MAKRRKTGSFLVVCCCWITGQYAFVIKGWKNTYSGNEDVFVTMRQKRKILEGAKLVVKGNNTTISKSTAAAASRGYFLTCLCKRTQERGAEPQRRGAKISRCRLL